MDPDGATSSQPSAAAVVSVSVELKRLHLSADRATSSQPSAAAVVSVSGDLKRLHISADRATSQTSAAAAVSVSGDLKRLHISADPDLDQIKKRLKRQSHGRLRATIASILAHINTPLADIVRDHALPRLPPQSLRRLRAVSAAWNRHISAPLFPHSNATFHRSISGVFSTSTPARFACFDPRSDSIPDASLSFMPDATVAASSHGLLCLRSPTTYYICNPATKHWVALPPPSLGGGAPAALVHVPHALSFRADYDLVLAFKISTGVYGFETFSSETGEWWCSGEICATEEIVTGSGVCAGGVAWWRTSMQTAVGYDPKADTVSVVTWPAGYDVASTWQLGAFDKWLGCTVVADSYLAVYVLEAGWWREVARYPVAEDPTDAEDPMDVDPNPHSEDMFGDTKVGSGSGSGSGSSSIVFGERPWPLRFQSGDLEVMLKVGRRVVGLDIAKRRLRDIGFRGEVWVCGVDFVSHINTLVEVCPLVVGKKVCIRVVPLLVGEKDSEMEEEEEEEEEQVSDKGKKKEEEEIA